MTTDVSVSIAGQAGQGMQSIAFTLAKIFTKAGFFTYTYHDIMSRIRGGSNSSIVRIKNTSVNSISDTLDLLIGFDKTAIINNIVKLKESGFLIFDGEKIQFEEYKPNYLPVPLERLAIESGKNKLMINSVATGSTIALLGWKVEECFEVIKQLFEAKGDELVNSNINSVKAGYEYVRNNVKVKASFEIQPLPAV